ncbi:MAG: 3-phosphoshikimate 1-carboxyvinyltransferase [Firmicutes bacterium]|nr:3-phosphoshikimate 1-carboxyvinyltransferase [Bacillota bacterium]
MIRTIPCGMRTGEVAVPASKSYAHRYLILAALSGRKATLQIDGLSDDITATIDCLRALGSIIGQEGAGSIAINGFAPAGEEPCHLYCKESGSTLRFLLPVVGALGKKAVFHMEGRLSQRPLAPLDQVLEDHGMTLQQEGELLSVKGQLQPGCYVIPGNISSQYITGLLLALPMLSGESTLQITGPVESVDYIAMTCAVLQRAGIIFTVSEDGRNYTLSGGQKSALSGQLRIEGDWSNAAFFLVLGALSKQGVLVRGLEPSSVQGDRAVLSVLRQMGAVIEEGAGPDAGILVKKGRLKGITVDAAPIPDLIPVLCVAAALAEGTTRVVNAGRLRLKESDRIASTVSFLSALGARIREEGDSIVIEGVKILAGGETDSFGDHRIAMAAAVAAAGAAAPVTIRGAQCIRKSYPRFYSDLAQLKEVL